MALGFLGAGSKSAEQEKIDDIAYEKQQKAIKDKSIEKNKKDKKMLQKTLGNTLGGGVASAMSFGSSGKGGIMGSLGLGPKKYTIPALFSIKSPMVPLAEIVPMSSVMKINRPPVNSFVTGKY